MAYNKKGYYLRARTLQEITLYSVFVITPI